MLWWTAFMHWLWVHTGTGNEPGSYYGFFSGFGSDLGEYIIISGVAVGLYHLIRKGNCETHGCWRISLHTTAAGHRVCHKHNPDGKLSHQHIIKEHLKALERRERHGRSL